MKKLISIICLILASILSLCACSYDSQQAKSSQDVAQHATRDEAQLENDCIKIVDELINSLPDCTKIEPDYGIISFVVDEKEKYIIDIYESGLETPKITYSILVDRKDSNENDVCTLSNSGIKIISSFISEITNENYSEDEIKQYLKDVKEKIDFDTLSENKFYYSDFFIKSKLDELHAPYFEYTLTGNAKFSNSFYIQGSLESN